jgi:hypothetical protein
MSAVETPVPPLTRWQKFKATFHDSEVIVWSRVQVLIGAVGVPVWLGVSQTDLSPLIRNPQWLAYWLIFNGVVTEILRRNREDFGGR